MSCVAAELGAIAPFGFGFDTPRLLRAWHALGCTQAQIYRDADRQWRADEIAATVAAAGLRINSLHGVFGEHIDPSSPDEAGRRHALEIYEAEGRFALDLGGPIVVLHPACNLPYGPDYSRGREYQPDEATRLQAQRWPHFLDFARQLADIGARLGVQYLLENVPWNSPLGHDVIALAEHVQSVGSEQLGICFDTGHAMTTTGKQPAEILPLCAWQVGCLHLHDTDGRGGSHLLPGQGAIDWPAFAAAAAQTTPDALRIIEIFKPAEEIAQLAADRGFAAMLRRCAGLR